MRKYIILILLLLVIPSVSSVQIQLIYDNFGNFSRAWANVSTYQNCGNWDVAPNNFNPKCTDNIAGYMNPLIKYQYVNWTCIDVSDMDICTSSNGADSQFNKNDSNLYLADVDTLTTEGMYVNISNNTFYNVSISFKFAAINMTGISNAFVVVQNNTAEKVLLNITSLNTSVQGNLSGVPDPSQYVLYKNNDICAIANCSKGFYFRFALDGTTDQTALLIDNLNISGTYNTAPVISQIVTSGTDTIYDYNMSFNVTDADNEKVFNTTWWNKTGMNPVLIMDFNTGNLTDLSNSGLAINNNSIYPFVLWNASSGLYDSGTFVWNGTKSSTIMNWSNAHLLYSTGFSVCVYVKPVTSGVQDNWNMIVSQKNMTIPRVGWELSHNKNSGKILFQFDSGAITSVINSSQILPSNVFTHICGVYNLTSTFLYINGSLNNWTNLTSYDYTINNTKPIRLSYMGDGVSGFNGTIDDLKIWNYALTAKDVDLLYKSNGKQLNSLFTQTGHTWSANVITSDGRTYVRSSNDFEITKSRICNSGENATSNECVCQSTEVELPSGLCVLNTGSDSGSAPAPPPPSDILTDLGGVAKNNFWEFLILILLIGVFVGIGGKRR